MELIRKIDRRLGNSGRKESWGEFLCPFCLQKVEKHLSSGKKQKSCGCASNKLKSESKKVGMTGKKHTEITKQKQSIAHIGENNPMYGKHPTEETRQKISIANKGKKITEEQRKKQSKTQKGHIVTEEQRQKTSKTMIKRGISSGKNNPMYGKTGELNPNWNNGSSFEPYGIEFNKNLKQQILKRANYKCQNPNCIHKLTKLAIHHIDYNKKNNNLSNLIALCISCHTKTNGKNNRTYWVNYYQNIINNTL